MEDIKQFNVDKLNVRIFKNRAVLGQYAGKEAAAEINKAIKAKGYANVMFAAAPSQNEMLEQLCNEKIDWSRVNAFHMDEYINLASDHPALFSNYLKSRIFNKFHFKSVNIINGNAKDINVEIERYSKLLRENPIDVCLLGIGENAHIAFNDPPVADFQDKTKIKTVMLEEKCRIQQVHDGCFTELSDVPKMALTVTVPAVVSAKVLICSVPGVTKANAVYDVLNGDITEKIPASIMRRHCNARLYLDQESGSRINNIK